MNPPLATLAASLALFTLACGAQPAAPQAHHAATPPQASAVAQAATADTPPAAPQLHADMRALWQGHVTATRGYAMAVKAGDSTAASGAADQVVANAKSIAGAVAGFYGPAAGEEMLRLLAGHWGGVQAMTDAAHAGNTPGTRQAMDALVANADEIARFLAGANPHLTADAVNGLLVAHAGHHAEQIRQIMAGDMAGEAETRMAMQAHMDVIADALAGAIARQFPDRVA